MDSHAEMLRADAAERELSRVNRVLARLLEMADGWQETFGTEGVRADLLADIVRRTIRETP